MEVTGYEPVWVVRVSWFEVGSHVTKGWNRGEPQPYPLPKGYLSFSEPQVGRQDWSPANVRCGGERERRRKVKKENRIAIDSAECFGFAHLLLSLAS